MTKSQSNERRRDRGKSLKNLFLGFLIISILLFLMRKDIEMYSS